MTYHIIFALLNLFFLVPTLAQEKEVKHSIGLKHDNDFLTFTDKYYSSGLFLSYRRVLDQGIFNSGKEQFSLNLAQQIYTPSKPSTTNSAELDRPFAGYIAINASWSYVNTRNYLETNFNLGLVGKASGAGSFHKWYHNAIGIPQPPSWVYELTNKIHANIYGSYIHEWQLSSKDFSVYLAVHPKFAAGTKDIYAQPEVIAHFGRRQAMTTSMAYNRIGSTEKEVFFSIRAGYRFVAHNALLEGHLLGDNSFYLVQPEKRFFYGGVDMKHRLGKNDYWIGYRFNTAETKETKAHKYVLLSYARSF